MDGWRDRLAFEIHARGFKLTKLSTSLGFHRDYISNVLSGKAKPSTEKLERICDAVGVPFANVLLGGGSEEKAAAAPGVADTALSQVQSLIMDGDYKNPVER